jgi:hypothetical protein
VDTHAFSLLHGAVISGSSPANLFKSTIFCGKPLLNVLFDYAPLGSSLDYTAAPVSKYAQLSAHFARPKSLFSIAKKGTSEYFCGSIDGLHFQKGFLFDNNGNYATLSNKRKYHGYIENLEQKISYMGEMVGHLPSGTGVITAKGELVYYGKFEAGKPVGTGFYFDRHSRLAFAGMFDTRPVYGVRMHGESLCEGAAVPTKEQEACAAGLRPISLATIGDYNLFHELFDEMQLRGQFRAFAGPIYKVKGRASDNRSSLSGFYHVEYSNGSKYYGWLKDSAPLGIGLMEVDNGRLKIVGRFDSDRSVKGYLVLELGSDEDPAKPRIVYGNLRFDDCGKLSVTGEAKVLLGGGKVYYGEMLSNSLTGYGTLISQSPEPSVLAGQFYCGKLNGIGTLKTADYFYQGEFLDSEFHGYGKMTVGKLTVKGKWSRGLCHLCTLSSSDNEIHDMPIQSMSLILETGTKTFEKKDLKGICEINFDSCLTSQLVDVYDGINEDSGIPPRSPIAEYKDDTDILNYKHLTSQPRLLDVIDMLMKGSRSKLPPKVADPSSKGFKALHLNQDGDQAFIGRSNSKESVLNKNTFRDEKKKKLTIEKQIGLSRMFKYYGYIDGAKEELVGEVRRFEERFIVLQSNLTFKVQFICSCNKGNTKYRMGEGKEFLLSGIGLEVKDNNRGEGMYLIGKREGLSISHSHGKNSSIEMYHKDVKHGHGLQISNDENEGKTSFLYNHYAGKLMSVYKFTD